MGLLHSLVAGIAMGSPIAQVQGDVAPRDVTPPDFTWWREARFGMFIHWGLYAEAAGSWRGRFLGGWTEWLLSKGKIDPVEYQRELLPRFDPAGFDADAVVSAAKRAGMGYIVITTKHHEGFCLWDSADSPSDLAMTPFAVRGRSPLRELADACQREGIRLGFYYSLLDWHDSDYLPRRAWDARSSAGVDYARYSQRMRTHLEELLGGQFGNIDILWGDGDWEHGPQAHGSPELLARARELQPGLLVNNRWSLPGDYDTPENTIPDAPLPRPWETCMTMNESWGYTPRVETYKPAVELVRMLADIASKDGNFLLNVGPDGDGRLDPVALERLDQIGGWMDLNAESIRGTRGAGTIHAPAVYSWGRLTVRQSPDGDGGSLYLHVFEKPESGEIVVPGLAAEVRGVSVLGLAGIGGEPIGFTQRGSDGVVALPAGMHNNATSMDMVIKVEVAGWPPIAGEPRPSVDAGLFEGSLVLGFDVAPGSEVLVTADGSEPRVGGLTTHTLGESQQSIPLTVTSRVRARSVVRGVVTGEEFADTYTLATPWPAVAGASPRIQATLMEGAPGQFSHAPGTLACAPTSASMPAPLVRAIDVHDVSLPIESWLPEDNFAVQFDGIVDVPATGIWTFWLTSDDGSMLWIDGKLVVDNDGPHGAKEVRGQAPLAAGAHAIRVGFFEGGGAAMLSLEWAGPGSDRATVPAAAFGAP
ncbi:MAG: alpha-L-fucosidase [Planctomycetota bacterium]|nr:alpha-L-fucosidase [Planctomycetota bacterium]